MQSIPQATCPFCYKGFDVHDPDPDYRTGVQCAACYAQHHGICWKHNGGKCAKCGETASFPFELASAAAYNVGPGWAAPVSASFDAAVPLAQPPQGARSAPAPAPAPGIAFMPPGMTPLARAPEPPPTAMTAGPAAPVHAADGRVSGVWRVSTVALGLLLFISVLLNLILLFAR
jgi:hypothetical protein